MLADWMLRLRALFKRTTVEREIDDELRFHFDHQVDSYVARGLERAEAVRRVRLEFGGLDQLKEEYRDALGVRLVDGFWRDVRLAVRALRATPIVTAVAILSLALGIGANTAIFSLIDSLLLRTLPGVVQPEQLVTMSSGNPGPMEPRWSYAFWKEIEERSHVFDGAFAWSARRFDLSAAGEIQSVEGVFATGSFFETLGCEPPLGVHSRPLTMYSADQWRPRGCYWLQPVATPIRSIAPGRRDASDDRSSSFTIIGVAPAGFFGTEVGRSMDIAVPLSAEPLLQGSASNVKAPFDKFNLWLVVALRLKPEQSLEAATTILRDMQPHIRESAKPHIPQVREFEFIKEPFTLSPISTGISELRRLYQRPLVAILFVVALVLLVACANIANLQLARARMRRHELSVRRALGAAPWQLSRQLLIESLLLAAVGAGFGLGSPRGAAERSSRRFRRTPARSRSTCPSIGVCWVSPWRSRSPRFSCLGLRLLSEPPAWRRSKPSSRRGEVWSANSVPICRYARGLTGRNILVLVVFAGLFISSLQRLTSRSLGFDTQRALISASMLRKHLLNRRIEQRSTNGLSTLRRPSLEWSPRLLRTDALDRG